MLYFIFGSVFGGTVGIVTMCLCTAAKNSDDFHDKNNAVHEKK